MKKNIILLHGFGCDRQIWQPILNDLNQIGTVRALNLPGWGDNDKSITNLNQIVDDVLAQAPTKAIYIGWSLGGLVATAITQQHPRRVQQLITIASTPKFCATTDWPGMGLTELYQMLANIQQNPARTLRAFFHLMLTNSNLSKTERKQILSELKLQSLPTTDTLAIYLNLLLEQDLRSNLSSIKAKSLHILGAKDPLTNANYPKKLSNLPNHSYQFIDDAGHVPFLSHPKEVVSLVKEFIHVVH